MAGVRAVLKALARATWREQRRLFDISSNHFFLFGIYFLRGSAVFIFLLAGLVMLFPLASDPMRKIPAERRPLWPLRAPELLWLRVSSIWLNPATWLIVALLVVGGHQRFGVELAALLLGAHVAGLLLEQLLERFPAAHPLRGLPLPATPFWILVRKNLRELVTVLDVYLATAISLSGMAYLRFASRPEAEAALPLALIVSLALSTHAVSLFGLDSLPGIDRYRLLPVSGLLVVAAKDVAVLLIQLALTLPLAPKAGLAAGLAALTVGHSVMLRNLATQSPWRFASGGSVGVGLIQLVVMMGTGVFAEKESAWILAPCLVAYAISLAYGSWRLTKTEP